MGIAFDAPLPPRAKVTRHAVRTLLGFENPWEWVLVQFASMVSFCLSQLSIGAHVYRAFDKAPFPFIRSFHDITAVLGDS